MFKRVSYFLVLVVVLQVIIVGCRRNRTKKCNGKINNVACQVADDLPYPTFYSDAIDTNMKVINFDSLTIQNSFSTEVSVCYYVQNSFSFINTANAYTAAYSPIKIQNRFDSIQMTTVLNYNANHAAGSSINDIMHHHVDYVYNWTGNGISSNQLITDFNLVIDNNQYYEIIAFYSRLNEKPQNSGDTVQIAFAYYLNDGVVIRDTTQKFILTY